MLTDCLFLVVVFVLQYATLGLGSEPGMIKREDHTRETTFNKIQGIVLIISKSVNLLHILRVTRICLFLIFRVKKPYRNVRLV